MLTDILDKIADKVRWGYLGAFIILLASYIITFYTTQSLLKKAEKVNHTNLVIINLDNLLSVVKDAETSLRGYLIIKDETFLDGYYKSPAIADTTIVRLKSLVSDNSLQNQRVDTLKFLIGKKYELLTHGLEVFKNNNYVVTDSMKKMAYVGKRLMDDIKKIVSVMQMEEESLIYKRSEAFFASSNLIKVINIISLIVAILLAFYSVITFNAENIARHEADRKAASLRQQLEIRVKELNELNVELVELKSIEKFAATGRISRTIAHEVRNPLTNINLAAEHLRSEISPNPETDILLDMITRNGNRINQLISDLLNSTKVTSLNFQKVSINDLLDSSLEFAEDRIELHGIKVIKKYGKDLCEILADVEKMNIAFLNIIVNAIEAMQPYKGVLEIKTEHKNNRCVVTIKDNGKGMNKDEVSKLFEPYFTTKENGTGLGLTNTQNIILAHKASIIAESTPGKGTTFTISFNYA